MLVQAAKFTAALKPVLISDSFDFGLALCGVGKSVATSKLSWYLKVNHKNPEIGGESVKVKAGDEVLWALAAFPYPNELSLSAPEQGDGRPAVPGPRLLLRRQGEAQAGRRGEGHRRERADRVRRPHPVSSASRRSSSRPTARTSPPTGRRSASVAGAPEADPLTARRLMAAAIALLLAALAAAGCGLGPGRGLGEVEPDRDPRLRRRAGPRAGLRRGDRSRHRDAGARTRRRHRDPLRRRLRAVDRRPRSRGGSRRRAPPTGSSTSTASSRRWARRTTRCTAARRSGGTTATGRRRCACRRWSAPGRSRFTGGYDGKLHPVSLACMGGGAACAIVRERLRRRRRLPRRRSARHGAIRVLVGTWGRLRADPAAAQIGRGPAGERRLRRAGETAAAAVQGLDEAGDAGALLGPRRGPGRRHPPLRSAADLGRDRLRRRPGCGPPPGCSTPPTSRDRFAVAAAEPAADRPCPCRAG